MDNSCKSLALSAIKLEQRGQFVGAAEFYTRAAQVANNEQSECVLNNRAGTCITWGAGYLGLELKGWS